MGYALWLFQQLESSGQRLELRTLKMYAMVLGQLSLAKRLRLAELVNGRS